MTSTKPSKKSLHTCAVSQKFPFDQAFDEARKCGSLITSSRSTVSLTEGIVIENRVSFDILRTFPVQCERMLGGDVNVSLQLVAENVVFKRILTTQFSRKTNKFVSTYSDPERGHIRSLCISVADLLKLYRFSTLCCENEKEADNEESADTLDNDRQHSEKQLKSRRNQLLKAASKHDNSSSDSTNFLGLLRATGVTPLRRHDHRMGNLDDFLDSKVMISASEVVSALAKKYENRKTRQVIIYSDEQRSGRFGTWLSKLVSKRLVNTLCDHFFFRKTLNASKEQEKTLTFEEPITMKEFYELIDDNTVYFDKHALYNCVFKRLNERQKAIVDKQTPLVISKIEDIPEEMPAYAFRQLLFHSYSPEFAEEVYNTVMDALQTWTIPKRFKNKRQQYVRNEWRYKFKPPAENERGWTKRKYIDNHKLKTQGLEEVYGSQQDLYVQEEEEEEQESNRQQENCATDKRYNADLQYAYPLPDKVVLKEIDGQQALYAFLTDEEALQRCVEIDEDQSLSLTEKLQELNSIGHSRVGGEYVGFLLLLPGENLTNAVMTSTSNSNDDASSLSESKNPVHYQDFYIPSSDKRLPTIVLIGGEH